MTAQADMADSAPQVIREEKVEYRDQDGNLLNEDQVAALEKEGKVSFQTRYETRTRVLDASGNEVDEEVPVQSDESHAPPHPDVDRLPSTELNEEGDRDTPATASPEDDIGKERSINRSNQDKKPRPASEGLEATRKDEL